MNTFYCMSIGSFIMSEGHDSTKYTATENYNRMIKGWWCNSVLPQKGDRIEWVVTDATHTTNKSVVIGCWGVKAR